MKSGKGRGKGKSKRNSTRKQKENKDIPSGLVSIAVAEGGGASKTEGSVERELKLKCRGEMKVKLRVRMSEGHHGDMRAHWPGHTTGEVPVRCDLLQAAAREGFESDFLKKKKPKAQLAQTLNDCWATVMLMYKWARHSLAGKNMSVISKLKARWTLMQHRAAEEQAGQCCPCRSPAPPLWEVVCVWVQQGSGLAPQVNGQNCATWSKMPCPRVATAAASLQYERQRLFWCCPGCCLSALQHNPCSDYQSPNASWVHAGFITDVEMLSSLIDCSVNLVASGCWLCFYSWVWPAQRGRTSCAERQERHNPRSPCYLCLCVITLCTGSRNVSSEWNGCPHWVLTKTSSGLCSVGLKLLHQCF